MKRNILYMIMCLAVLLPVSASPSFRTAELERLAQVLALDISLLPEGYSHPEANGLRLTVHQVSSTVDHIGLNLFSDDLRTVGKSPIFDFLERYFLQLKYPPQVKRMQHMIRDDEFRFLKGSLQTVDELLVTDGFSYQYDNHLYLASWSREGQTLLSVSFPVEYELISGENKIEAENNLQADIQSTQVVAPEETVSGNDTYLSDDFSNRVYAVKGNMVLSPLHPAESAANMMLSLQTAGDYQIRLTQISYGFKKSTFEVPLKQWIAFCQQHGCKLYFAVEKIREDGVIEVVVMAVNSEENYNHVLTAQIAPELLETESGIVEGRLYPYVPTHNVLNMFAAYRKSNPKTFVSK